jgi:hypothetical protein
MNAAKFPQGPAKGLERGVTPKGWPVEGSWVAVSVVHPCPVCGFAADCLVHEDEPFAACASLPSDWPLTNGDWLHRLSPRFA